MHHRVRRSGLSACILFSLLQNTHITDKSPCPDHGESLTNGSTAPQLPVKPNEKLTSPERKRRHLIIQAVVARTVRSSLTSASKNDFASQTKCIAWTSDATSIAAPILSPNTFGQCNVPQRPCSSALGCMAGQDYFSTEMTILKNN